MKALLVIAVLFLSGCAFGPPDAYPIFKLPTETEASALKASENQNAVFGVPQNVADSESKLLSQRLWYLHLAENSQKGVFNQSDWTLAGATLGTLGGLAKSVPTAAVGALIGGGSAMIGSRYSQNAQTTIYLKAAEKIGCVGAVVGAYSSAKSTEQGLENYWIDADRNITKSASFASLQVQADVRATLLTLTPTQPDPKSLATLYNDYGTQRKSVETETSSLTTARAAQTRVLKMKNSTVADRKIELTTVDDESNTQLDVESKSLADYKHKLEVTAEAATPEEKRIASIAIAALDKAIATKSNISKRNKKIVKRASPTTGSNDLEAVDYARLESDTVDSSIRLARAQAKATNTEIALCAATGKPASTTPL